MTERIIETYQIEWRGIAIEIRYAPSWSNAYLEVYGEPLAHLEVDSIEPVRAELPISASIWLATFWSEVETRAYPKIMHLLYQKPVKTLRFWDGVFDRRK